MSLFKHILKYEGLIFIRNRFQLVLLAIVFLLGCYSIYYGRTEIDKQRDAISSAIQETTKAKQERVKNFFADTSTALGKRNWQSSAVTRYVWHKHVYAATFKPSGLSALALGQRDLQPYYYKLTAMSIFYQIFQNEIANPQKLAVGNFDLSFVLTYIFPLLIIAFCYGLLAADKDQGLLNLLRAQSGAVRNIVLFRLLFYFLLVAGLALVLCITGFACSYVCFEASSLYAFLTWIGVVFSYLLFWFSLLFFLIAFNKSSMFNALTGIAVWLIFLIALPATLNIFIGVAKAVNSAVLSGIGRRTGVVDEENEENQKKVIRGYLLQNPGYFSATVFDENLIAKGFAAYTALNDQKSAKLVEVFQQRVKEREALARLFDPINPAVNVQTMLDHLAGTDLSSFQHFYKQVKAFHGKLVAFYYPKLFADENLKLEEIQHAPQFKLQTQKINRKLLFHGLGCLWLASTIVFLLGLKKLKKSI